MVLDRSLQRNERQVAWSLLNSRFFFKYWNGVGARGVELDTEGFLTCSRSTWVPSALEGIVSSSLASLTSEIMADEDLFPNC